MTTTFQDVDLVIAELVTLFGANNSWEAEFGYFPGVNAIKGYSPVLIIEDEGTRTRFAAEETNPVSYRIRVSSWVIAYIAGERTVAQATTQRRALNKTIRQVVRDNAGSLTNANLLHFADEFSSVDTLLVEGVPYMVETFMLQADLARGAI